MLTDEPALKRLLKALIEETHHNAVTLQVIAKAVGVETHQSVQRINETMDDLHSRLGEAIFDEDQEEDRPDG